MILPFENEFGIINNTGRRRHNSQCRGNWTGWRLTGSESRVVSTLNKGTRGARLMPNGSRSLPLPLKHSYKGRVTWQSGTRNRVRGTTIGGGAWFWGNSLFFKRDCLRSEHGRPGQKELSPTESQVQAWDSPEWPRQQKDRRPSYRVLFTLVFPLF